MFKLENNMLGLDRVFEEVMKPVTEKYPFYNLFKSDKSFRIDLAVAGFSESELDVYLEGEYLVIAGNNEVSTEVPYFKSISSKNFKRSFILGNSLEVGTISLKYGILSIELKEVPKAKESRSFKITKLD